MKKGIAVVLVALVVAAVLAWPRLNDVETGRTPEYPDLTPRVYKVPPATVERAVKEAIAALPRFAVVGSGRGPGGTEIQALARTRVLRFEDELTARIRSTGAGTTLSVRSRSRTGTIDFGQNARNIRELLGEVDRRLPPAR